MGDFYHYEFYCLAGQVNNSNVEIFRACHVAITLYFSDFQRFIFHSCWLQKALRCSRLVLNNISIVQSAESELMGSSSNYLPQFTLQGSDFPRLGKSTRISKDSDSMSLSKHNVANAQKVATANSTKAAPNFSEVSHKICFY